MRARVVAAAVAAVYLILPPHPKNKEQKLKLEKMVFKDWSESKKQRAKYWKLFGFWFNVCTRGRQPTARRGVVDRLFF